MPDYPLSITGAEIDSALGKVHNADTAPTNASTNMVTSGGVHTAINNLDLTNLAGSSLVTESEGIAGNDNDTTIPTSAAVKDFVDNEGTPLLNRIKTHPDGDVDTIPTSGVIDIPTGYKATSAVFYGNRITLTLYTRDISNGNSTNLGSGSIATKTTEGVGSSSIDFTDVPSTSNNFLYYTVVNFNGFEDKFYGLGINLEKV